MITFVWRCVACKNHSYMYHANNPRSRSRIPLCIMITLIWWWMVFKNYTTSCKVSITFWCHETYPNNPFEHVMQCLNNAEGNKSVLCWGNLNIPQTRLREKQLFPLSWRVILYSEKDYHNFLPCQFRSVTWHCFLIRTSNSGSRCVAMRCHIVFSITMCQ